MTVYFIVCGAFCFLVYLLENYQNNRMLHFYSDTEPDEISIEEEEVSSAKHNRRVWEIMKRQKQQLQDWERELNYRDRETSIEEKLVQLGKTLITIGDQRLDLREMLLQITHQKNLNEIWEKGLMVKEQKIELKDLLSELNHRENMVILKQQEVLIDGKHIHAKQLLNQVERRENLLELEQKDIVLNGKRVELKELFADILFQSKMVQVGKAENALEKREITIDGKRVELKELLNQVEHRGNLQELQHKNIELDGKRVELRDLLSEINYQGKMVKIGKAELALGWKELTHAYNLKAFELQKTLHHVKTLNEQLRLSRIAFKVQKQEEAMKLYAQKLALTEQHIRQMYAIRSEWLKVQAKENNLGYREQKLQLQSLYNDTQSKIRELHLTRWENEMIWDKKELERRAAIINYIEDVWYHNSGIPVAKNMLDHYERAGYIPNSPLAIENQNLRELIRQLERQLPPR